MTVVSKLITVVIALKRPRRSNMNSVADLPLGCPEEVVELADYSGASCARPGEVLVASEYAPVNHSEILKIVGRYPLLPRLISGRGRQ
jgi:NADPH:quinone reductase-like Zn-dependent oxidoreductase